MSSIKKDAEKFLKSRIIVSDYEPFVGILVTSNMYGFEIVQMFRNKKGGYDEEKIHEFTLVDVWDEDPNQMILNFKNEIKKAIGRKHYKMGETVYSFLTDEDIEEEYADEYFVDTAKERAEREAAEEETAEHEFERFLKSQEEQEDM